MTYYSNNSILSVKKTPSAQRDDLQVVFNRYARHEDAGQRYMKPYEFLQDYLGYLKGDNIDPKTLDILSSLVDLNKDQSRLGFDLYLSKTEHCFSF